MFNPNGGESSATDGDMDAAFALFLAAAFWEEPVYHAAGVRICAALYACCFNNDTKVLRHTPNVHCAPLSKRPSLCHRQTCGPPKFCMRAQQIPSAPLKTHPR